MPNVREIVLQRAKVPAKIHFLVNDDAPAGAKLGDALSGAKAGPVIAQYSADQVAVTTGDAASQARAVPSGRRSAPVTKASEGRKPRCGSEPSRRGGNAGAGRAASDDASEARSARPKARASSVRARISDAAPPVDRNNMGKVPAYLRRRQEEMAEDRRRAERPASPVPPPGYRKVPESEKQATLEVLRRRKTEVETSQRKLPFKIETAGQKQREKDLQDRIAHLDKLIGMFSQPVVFIPADADPIATAPPPPSPEAINSKEVAVSGRPPRIREASVPSEASHESQASRPQRGRSECESQEVTRQQPARQVAPTRQEESRSRAEALCRQQLMSPSPLEAASEISSVRTGVKIAAPPGGKCTLQLY